jgi:hypothetical protein
MAQVQVSRKWRSSLVFLPFTFTTIRHETTRGRQRDLLAMTRVLPAHPARRSTRKHLLHLLSNSFAHFQPPNDDDGVPCRTRRDDPTLDLRRTFCPLGARAGGADVAEYGQSYPSLGV